MLDTKLRTLTERVAEEIAIIRKKQFKVLQRGVWVSDSSMDDEKEGVAKIEHEEIDPNKSMVIYTIMRDNAFSSPLASTKAGKHYLYTRTLSSFSIRYSGVALTGGVGVFSTHTRIEWMIVKH